MPESGLPDLPGRVVSSLLLDSVDYVWSRIRGPRAAHDYTSRGLGPWPLDVRDREWYGSADLALAATDQARRVLRQGLGALGEAGFWRPLGPEWDEYAADPWAGLSSTCRTNTPTTGRK